MMNVHRMTRHHLTALLIGVSLSLLPKFASAQSVGCDDVESCARQGADLFQSGDFRQAALFLNEAHRLEPVPVLLYNIARAYQQDNRCYMSNRYFQDYLDTGDSQAASQANQYAPDEATCAERYSEYMTQSDDALNSGDLETAEESLATALELSDEPNARIMYGQTLFHLGRCQDAENFLDGLIDEPDMTAAQTREMENDLQRARRCIEDRGCEAQRNACEDERRSIEEEHQLAIQSTKDTGLIVSGIGGVVFLIAIIHDVASQGLIDDYEVAAAEGNANDYNDLQGDIESGQTISLILYGAGVVGVAIGAVIYLTADSPSPAANTDCTGICWDFGLSTPNTDVGFWFGAEF